MNNAYYFEDEDKTIEDYEEDIRDIEEANKCYYKYLIEHEKKNIFQKIIVYFDFWEGASSRIFRGINNNNDTIRGLRVLIGQKRIEDIARKV